LNFLPLLNYTLKQCRKRDYSAFALVCVMICSLCPFAFVILQREFSDLLERVRVRVSFRIVVEVEVEVEVTEATAAQARVVNVVVLTNTTSQEVIQKRIQTPAFILNLIWTFVFPGRPLLLSYGLQGKRGKRGQRGQVIIRQKVAQAWRRRGAGVAQAQWNKILFHVNFNNYSNSNNSPCSRYLFDNYCRHLKGKDHNIDGTSDCLYNNGNYQANDNDSNNQ
jgi:hypothetical protein